jgi:hypothetical protein
VLLRELLDASFRSHHLLILREKKKREMSWNFEEEIVLWCVNCERGRVCENVN